MLKIWTIIRRHREDGKAKKDQASNHFLFCKLTHFLLSGNGLTIRAIRSPKELFILSIISITVFSRIYRNSLLILYRISQITEFFPYLLYSLHFPLLSFFGFWRARSLWYILNYRKKSMKSNPRK